MAFANSDKDVRSQYGLTVVMRRFLFDYNMCHKLAFLAFAARL
jgi:hypothetical protein